MAMKKPKGCLIIKYFVVLVREVSNCSGMVKNLITVLRLWPTISAIYSPLSVLIS